MLPAEEGDVDRLRRLLLKAVTAGASAGVVVAGDLLLPSAVVAADWNRAAFTATSLPEAIRAAGAGGSSASGGIVITTVDIAENGAQVPLEVISNIPDSQNISIFIEKNPMPLAASLTFARGAQAHVRLQVKMAESSRVRVVVRAADGRTYHASREVKVTLGGCGA